MGDFRDLLAYKKAFDLAMKLFEVSKTLPSEERFALVNQIRRSSRSVCSNIAEAYRKRRYPQHYLSKLSDSEAENAETHVWIDFAYSCKYISEEEYKQFEFANVEVGKLIWYMMENPGKFK